MPRYLAKDYLAELLQYQQDLLLSRLLVCPDYLDHEIDYVHTGGLPDDAYRSPWKRAKSDVAFLLSETNSELIADTFRSLHQNQVPTLEIYDSFSLFHEYTFLEIIPSSNPESPPPTLDEIKQLFADNAKKGMKETFCKEKLHQDNEGNLLEEVEIPNYFTETLKILPDVMEISKRLRPKLVKDPFFDENGHPITEEQVMREERVFCEATKTDIDLLRRFKQEEVFEKECLTFIEDRIIEDQLSPSTSAFPTEAITYLLTPGIELCVSTQGDKTECSKAPFDTDNDELNGDSLEKEMKNLNVNPVRQDIQSFPHVPLNEGISFEKINSIPDESSNNVLNEILLESPMQQNSCAEKDELSSDGVSKLKRMEITPRTSPTMLSEESKDKLLAEIWQEEKSCSEVIAMQLQVPVVKSGMPDPSLSVHQTVSDLGLSYELSAGYLELDLPWDPLSNSLDSMIKINKLEKFNNDGVVATELRNRIDFFEKFSKCDPAYLYDWQDKTIDITTKTIIQGKGDFCIPDIKSLEEKISDKNKTDNLQKTGKEPTSKDRNNDNQKSTVNLLKNLDAGTSISIKKATKLSDSQNIQIPRSQKEISKSSNRIYTLGSSLSSDPLEQFIMLRTGKLSFTDSQTVNTCKEEHTTENKQQEKQVEDNNGRKTPRVRQNLIQENSDAPPTPQSKKSKKEDKSNVLEIRMSDEFTSVQYMLEQYCQPTVLYLHQNGLIPVGHSFKSLTPDVTRFLVKQHEKVLLDSGVKAQEDRTYKEVLTLHAIANASEILTTCCLQSSIAHLAAVEEKHQQLLLGNLEKLRQALCKAQCVLDQKKLNHPKISVLCSHLAEYLYRKRIKSPDHEPKVLIICRDLRSLMTCILNSVSAIQGILPDCLIDSAATYQIISDRLDEYNCIIVSGRNIGDDFPWAQFSLVVEYEHVNNSKWQELCERQNIRYTVLKVIQGTVNNAEKPEAVPYRHESQLTLIGSQILINNAQLLQLLESRNNIQILERNYSKLSLSYSAKFADIIIDERTCIVLQDLTGLSDDCQIEPLMKKLSVLSMKYCLCWVLLHSTSTLGSVTEQYLFAGAVISNVSKLYGACTHLKHKRVGFEVKVLFSSTVTETAWFVRQAAEKAMQYTKVWSKEDWLKRSWLAEEISLHERFLLSFPCLNSFSAQVLLTIAPLKKLLQMPHAELVTECPWIPEKFLQVFYNIAHCEFGFNLQSSSYPDNTSNVTVAKANSPSQVTVTDMPQNIVDYSPDGAGLNMCQNHIEHVHSLSTDSWKGTKGIQSRVKPNEHEKVIIQNELMSAKCNMNLTRNKTEEEQVYKRENSDDFWPGYDYIKRSFVDSAGQFQSYIRNADYSYRSTACTYDANKCQSIMGQTSACQEDQNSAMSFVTHFTPFSQKKTYSDALMDCTKAGRNKIDNDYGNPSGVNIPRRDNQHLSQMPHSQKMRYQPANGIALCHIEGNKPQQTMNSYGFDAGHYQSKENNAQKQQWPSQQLKLVHSDKDNHLTPKDRTPVKNMYYSNESLHRKTVHPESWLLQSQTDTPLTPRIRKPLESYHLSNGSQSYKNNVNVGLAQPFVRTKNISNSETVRRDLETSILDSISNRCLQESSLPETRVPESPPMDLDYDDDDVNYNHYNTDQHVPSPSSGSSDYEPADDTVSLFTKTCNRLVVTATTPKRRRLTYEKVPGAKGGQTRLSFV